MAMFAICLANDKQRLIPEIASREDEEAFVLHPIVENDDAHSLGVQAAQKPCLVQHQQQCHHQEDCGYFPCLCHITTAIRGGRHAGDWIAQARSKRCSVI